MAERVSRRFLHLDSWRAAVTVLIVGAVISLVWLVYLTARVWQTTAQRQATITANYNACIVSIPVMRKVNLFVINAENVADVLLQNSRDMHAVTPPGTDVYQQQTKNIARLARSIDRGKGVRLPVPTRAECERRRDEALA